MSRTESTGTGTPRSVGNRVFARPAFSLSDDERRALAELDISNIADAVKGIGVMDPAVRLLSELRATVVGPALTVTITPGNGLMIRKAVAMAQAGDVIVVNGGGNRERAVLGGSVVADMAVTGVACLVLDGMVRDLEELGTLGIPVFARGNVPRSGSDLHGYGEVLAPIACGGAVVLPGDAVVASAEGVLILPRRDLAWIIEEAGRVQERKGSAAGLAARVSEARDGRPRYDRVAVDKALRASGCVEVATGWADWSSY